MSALFIYSFANLSLDRTAETKKAFEKTFEIYRSIKNKNLFQILLTKEENRFKICLLVEETYLISFGRFVPVSKASVI